MIFKNFLKRLSGRVLFFPGCLTKEFAKKEFENYKEILKKLNVKTILIKDESCCALPLLNSGYKKEAKNIAQKNLELFKKRKVYKIITSCPACYYAFKIEYPKLLKEWDIEVEHISETIHHELKKNKVRISTEEKVSYHDPCYLGRYLGEYEKPREIIRILGGELIEPIKSREEALCCGGDISFKSNHKNTSKKIAKLRLSHFDSGVSKIITPCASCYLNLSENDSRVIELSTFVLSKLRKIAG